MIDRLVVFILSFSIASTAFLSESIGQDALAETPLASEYLLPASTKAWLSVPDYERMCDQFGKTEFGELAKDELLKPFIDSLKTQARDWLNNQNVRLGVKVEDLQSVRTGEICIAGVLQQMDGEQEDGKLGRGSHGIVLLVDVSETEDKANELMKKVDADFESRDAAEKTFEINGVQVTKWTVQRPKMLLKTKSTFHTIAGGWLLVSDNENVFREIIQRLANVKQADEAESLSSQIAFQNVMKNTEVDEVVPDVRWFVDPFGYVELAQAIEKEDHQHKVRTNDVARILKDEGFNILHGVGGQVSFATGDHEILHRTFVYAPREVNGNNEKRFFGLFDFENHDGKLLKPEEWVPADISAHISTIWDMNSALENFGGLFDAFMKEEGAWDNIIDGLKTDMDVNIPKLVASFDNQITIICTTARPIDEDSERVAFCLPIQENEEELLGVVKRALGGEKAFTRLKILGKEVLLVEAMEEEIPDDLGIWEDPDVAEEEEDGHGDEAQDFELFEKKYFTVVHNQFVVANNKEFLKQIIKGNPKSTVTEADDYQNVRSKLDDLTDTEKVSIRHFGRVDRALETNYEMLRQGKMGMSNTMLARILNRVLRSNATGPEANEPRAQQLDGSKLPADYEKFVAKYFGPMGWVMETDTDGWRLTGCLIKKKPVSEVVQKPLTRR